MSIGVITLEDTKFTPTQQRIIDLLSDGMPHSKAELHSCLNDELGSQDNIKPHLSTLRRALRPQGKDIACQLLGRRSFYLLVRILASNTDGYR